MKKIVYRIKIKSNISEEVESAWQAGKFIAKIDVNWKGETSNSDRKGEIDFTYDYRVGWLDFPLQIFRFTS